MTILSKVNGSKLQLLFLLDEQLKFGEIIGELRELILFLFSLEFKIYFYSTSCPNFLILPSLELTNYILSE